ncbi:MAG: energy-coupling factor ABC transporter ATP-binding protein [Gemmatimonadaceae bacterium]|jgi:cobalt/nickel transport system ATP-binding protein|nr:energy-coupling factor ABC transporter ATP-binding protein [Gemmatimonadaceae bacterium]
MRATPAGGASAERIAPSTGGGVPPVLAMERCTVWRGAGAARVRALDALSLTIARGRRTVLLGANGAGKSTVLLLLAGLLAPDEGVVRIDGRAMPSARDEWWSARVGWVGSDPDDLLIAPMVRDDLAFGLLNRGDAPDAVRRAVEGVAERFGLTALLDRAVHTLSHGERQRLVLAGALVLEPPILLLDEPTTGLDRRWRRALTSQLTAIAGCTLVVATHDLRLATSWAEQVVVLDRGQIAACGAPAAVLRDASWCEAMGIGEG